MEDEYMTVKYSKIYTLRLNQSIDVIAEDSKAKNAIISSINQYGNNHNMTFRTKSIVNGLKITRMS